MSRRKGLKNLKSYFLIFLRKTTYELSAKVSSENVSVVKHVLEKLIGTNGNIRMTENAIEIHAKLEGESARDLNRLFLSEMRRAEKRTRFRSEWRHNNIIETFFDYVPKGVRRVE
jgi:hypothetical protein